MIRSLGKLLRVKEISNRLKVRLTCFVIALLVAAGQLHVFAQGGYNVSFFPTDRCYIQTGHASDSNFGGLMLLRYNYAYGLLKYNIKGLSGSINKAELLIKAAKSYVNVGFVANDSWDQYTVTYKTAPEEQYELAAGILNNEGKLVVDVTRAVLSEQAGDGLISFHLSTDAPGTDRFLVYTDVELRINLNYTPKKEKIIISPEGIARNELNIPLNSVSRAKYTAMAVDQNGALAGTPDIEWAVEPETGGVTISDGVLSVESAAEPGKIAIIARDKTDKNICGKYDIELYASIPNKKQHPYSVVTEDLLELVRERIKVEPYKDQYDKMKKTASAIPDAKYNDLEGSSPSAAINYNFTVPDGVKSMKVSLQLSGKGNVVVDNVKILHVGKANLDIEDSGFEGVLASDDETADEDYTPSADEGWLDIWTSRIDGEGEVKRIERGAGEGYVAGGKSAVKLSVDNGTAAIEYNKPLEVDSNSAYTVYADYSQTEELQNGFYFVVEFFDQNNQKTGSLISPRRNMVTRSPRAGLSIGENPSVYAIEGDLKYAENTKKVLMYTLDIMIWGMQRLLETGESMTPGYQAVHMGRAIGTAAIAYDLITNSGVITPEEDNLIREQFYWIADVLMDRRYYDYEQYSKRIHNYNADRATGIGLFAIVFPEYRKSAGYLENAIENVEWLLDNALGQTDGSWPEVIRYHAAVMDHMIPFFEAIQNYDGRDYYQNRNFKNMFKFLMETQTSKDQTSLSAKGLAGYPQVGDSNWREGGVNLVGFGAYKYKDTDPVFSRNLMYMWQRAGTPISSYNRILCLTSFDLTLPAEKPLLKSKVFEDIKQTVFRQNFGTEKEDYFFMSTTKYLSSHQHQDRGSFTIYAHETPFVVDSGSGGYGDGQSAYYKSSEAHNLVTFYNEVTSAFAGGTTTCSAVDDFITSGALDYVKSNLTNPKLNSLYNRHAAFVKNGYDVYIIWDEIESSKKAKLNLYTISKNAGVTDNNILFDCYNNMSMDMAVLYPQNILPEFSEGGIAPGFPQPDGKNMHRRMTYYMNPGEDSLSFLYPRENSEDKMRVDTITQGAYKITVNGRWFIALVPIDGKSDKIDLSGFGKLVDMKTGEVLKTSTVSITGGVLKLYCPVGYGISKPADITASIPESIAVPASGFVIEKFSGEVFDQFENQLPEANIEWSILDNNSHLRIIKNTGQLVCLSSAQRGSIVKIKAESGGFSKIFELLLK